MAGRTEQSPVRGNVDTRLKIAALWTAMLFIFAYVDLFSLYRPDVRADLEAGRLFAFDVSQTFLFLTTLYIIFPSLMIYLTLVLPRGITRGLNVALAAVYAVTVVGSAVGEWGYFVLGSAAEVALLGAVVYHAWTWRETVG
ncbi:MAG TPA: DUF6326 family protein [Kribbellaceae bacterium]|nr:DUF6326 family protein [Kribbellaceae bacterium]